MSLTAPKTKKGTNEMNATELKQAEQQTEGASGVGSMPVLAAPVRRHPDCAESDCQTCLDDHHYLGLYIGLKCGGSLLIDWLGEYRKWLDKQGIPAEVNGWASRQAFDEKNVLAFIEDWCS